MTIIDTDEQRAADTEILLGMLSEMELKLIPETDPILVKEIPALDFESTGLDKSPELLAKIADKLGEKMLDLNGIGLSANQVGINLPMFVMRTYPDVTVCINPRIVDASVEQVMMVEGCLTYPGLAIKIKRPAHVRVRYQNVLGEFVTEKLTGLTARVFQHEMDHIKGKNFINRAGPVAKDLALRKWNKIRKQLNLKRKYSYGV